MAIDNFELIKPLLSFNSEDEFYFVQIIQRKKDNKNNPNIQYLGSNNSSRLIKAYYINSIEKLEKQKEEMIGIAKLFNARIGINLNKRSYYKTAFNTLQHIANQLHNKEFKYIHRSWNTACGKHNGDDKIWLLDFDYIPTNPDWYINIKGYLFGQQPLATDKVLAFIPSTSGVHVITKGFDTRKFTEDYPDVEIHKNNPTNLYIP